MCWYHRRWADVQIHRTASHLQLAELSGRRGTGLSGLCGVLHAFHVLLQCGAVAMSEVRSEAAVGTEDSAVQRGFCGAWERTEWARLTGYSKEPCLWNWRSVSLLPRPSLVPAHVWYTGHLHGLAPQCSQALAPQPSRPCISLCSGLVPAWGSAQARRRRRAPSVGYCIQPL